MFGLSVDIDVAAAGLPLPWWLLSFLRKCPRDSRAARLRRAQGDRVL